MCFFLSFPAHIAMSRMLGAYGFNNDTLLTSFLPGFIFGMIIARNARESGSFSRMFFSPAASIISAAMAVALIWMFDNAIQIGIPTQNLLFIALFRSMFGISSFISKSVFMRRTISYLSHASYVVFLLHMGFNIIMFEMLIRLHIIDGRISNGFIAIGDPVYWAYCFVPIFAFLTMVSYYIQKKYDSFAKLWLH
jgi:hypothetical protein